MGDADGLIVAVDEADGDVDAVGEADGLIDAVGEADGDVVGDVVAVGEADGLIDAVAESDGVAAAAAKGVLRLTPAVPETGVISSAAPPATRAVVATAATARLLNSDPGDTGAPGG